MKNLRKIIIIRNRNPWEMITSENILKIPGISKDYAIASNGGTKIFNNFVKGIDTWITIEFNGDNFIYNSKICL